MTREEALTQLRLGPGINEDVSEEYNDAVDMAIESLEQGDILDKIRAEITHLTITEGGGDYIRKMAELYSLKFKVLEIIDKYKAESGAKRI